MSRTTWNAKSLPIVAIKAVFEKYAPPLVLWNLLGGIEPIGGA